METGIENVYSHSIIVINTFNVRIMREIFCWVFQLVLKRRISVQTTADIYTNLAFAKDCELCTEIRQPIFVLNTTEERKYSGKLSFRSLYEGLQAFSSKAGLSASYELKLS